jgi:hypothetical protein
MHFLGVATLRRGAECHIQCDVWTDITIWQRLFCHEQLVSQADDDDAGLGAKIAFVVEVYHSFKRLGSVQILAVSLLHVVGQRLENCHGKIFWRCQRKAEISLVRATRYLP